MWGAIGGLGATSGALLGGLLTQGLGWPAIFLINVPIGAAVIVVGRRIVPESRREDIHRHFDVAGALLVTLGLIVAVYGIVRSESLGWGSAGVLGPLALAAALLALFALVEGRFAPAPLLPLSILRMGRLRAANIVIALLYSGVFSMWFFLTLYLQQVLGYSALRAGLAFMPMTLSVALAASLAPRLVARFGVRPVLAAGMLSSAAGLGLLTGIAPGDGYLTVLPGGMLGAGGLGLALVPATIAAVQGISAEQSGLASGLLNTSRLVGGALGLAVLSTIADSHTSSQLAHGASSLGALTSGYQLALGLGALISLLGAFLAVVLLRPRPAGIAVEPASPAVEPAASCWSQWARLSRRARSRARRGRDADHLHVPARRGARRIDIEDRGARTRSGERAGGQHEAQRCRRRRLRSPAAQPCAVQPRASSARQRPPRAPRRDRRSTPSRPPSRRPRRGSRRARSPHRRKGEDAPGASPAHESHRRPRSTTLAPRRSPRRPD